MTRAALWEIRLAVEAALDQYGSARCSVAEALDVVCQMHGLDDPRDRAIVERALTLRLAPAERAA